MASDYRLVCSKSTKEIISVTYPLRHDAITSHMFPNYPELEYILVKTAVKMATKVESLLFYTKYVVQFMAG